MAKSAEQFISKDPTASASHSVWCSIGELEIATGKENRQIANGIYEAGPPRENNRGVIICKNVLGLSRR